MALKGFKVCAHAVEAEKLVSDPTIGHFKLEALKADRLEHGAEDDRHDRHSSDDDNDDDDELPPLSDLLHEWRRERSAEMAPLSPTQCMMTEQLLDGSGLEGGLGMADAGAKIATLKPGDKPGGSPIPGILLLT